MTTVMLLGDAAHVYLAPDLALLGSFQLLLDLSLEEALRYVLALTSIPAVPSSFHLHVNPSGPATCLHVNPSDKSTIHRLRGRILPPLMMIIIFLIMF